MLCTKCNGERFIGVHANVPDIPCPLCNTPPKPLGGLEQLVRSIDSADDAKRKADAATLAWLYVEFGFKCAERGLNLEGTLLEFRKVQKSKL